MKQPFIENKRPGVRIELFTNYVWDAMGLWRTKFFSDYGLRIISKVQMLLQQTFVLEKKYSKCQSRNFWTQSSLAQEKAQNPTSLESSHSLLFIPYCSRRNILSNSQETFEHNLV